MKLQLAGLLLFTLLSPLPAEDEGDDIALSLSCPVQENVFIIGKDDPVVNAEVQNRSPNRREISLAYKVSNTDGTVLGKEEVQIRVPGKSGCKVVIPVGIKDRPGSYRLTVQVVSGEMYLQKSSVDFSLAVERKANDKEDARLLEQPGASGVKTDRKESEETKLLDDFEDVDWGRKWNLGWMGSGHEGTSMSSSQEQKHGGRMSGKLSYQADPEKGQYGLCYVEVDREIPLPENPKKIGVWIYGDKSGNSLSLRIQCSSKEIFQFELARKIDWEGWKYLETDFDKPCSINGADGNGKLESPAVFQGIVVGIVPARKTEGVLYFDGLVVKY